MEALRIKGYPGYHILTELPPKSLLEIVKKSIKPIDFLTN